MAIVDVRGLSDEMVDYIKSNGLIITLPEYMRALEALARAVEGDADGFGAHDFHRIEEAMQALQAFPDWRTEK